MKVNDPFYAPAVFKPAGEITPCTNYVTDWVNPRVNLEMMAKIKILVTAGN
jgi:hypothetical protein